MPEAASKSPGTIRARFHSKRSTTINSASLSSGWRSAHASYRVGMSLR
jgi:hypothetical protein